MNGLALPCVKCTGQNGVHYLTCPSLALPAGMGPGRAVRTEATDAADWYQAT